MPSQVLTHGAVEPSPLKPPAVVVNVQPFAMLLAPAPLTLVRRPVSVDHLPEALLQIFLVVADIGLALRPGKLPPPVHFVIEPGAFVLPPIVVDHDPLALPLVVPVLPDVLVPVRECELPFPVLLSVAIGPLELRPV